MTAFSPTFFMAVFLLLLLLVIFWPRLKKRDAAASEPEARARRYIRVTIMCAVLFWLPLSLLLLVLVSGRGTKSDHIIGLFALTCFVFFVTAPVGTIVGFKAIKLIGYRRAKRAVWSLVAIWAPFVFALLFSIFREVSGSMGR